MATAEVLREMSIFGALSDDTIEFLRERLETVRAAAGEYFFRQGEMGDAVYVLEEGRAEVVKARHGREIVLAEFDPGACFGEIALVAISPRTASVRAATDCRASRLPNAVLHELYRRDLEQFTILQMNLGREIARRLNETSDALFERLLAEAEGDHGVTILLGLALK